MMATKCAAYLLAVAASLGAVATPALSSAGAQDAAAQQEPQATKPAPVVTKTPAAIESKLTLQLHLYADPRVKPTLGVGGGPNGDGANFTAGGGPIVDFWWTAAVGDKKTEKYLTETGFTGEVLNSGGSGKAVWRFGTTQAGQGHVDVPVGAWYTLEISFHDNQKDGHLAATQNVYDDQRRVLYTHRFDQLFQNPTTDQLGELQYSWFTNCEPNVTRLFAWFDWREEIVADKVEITNVATLYPTKIDGSLQDWSSSPAVSTGGTGPEDWEKMADASARLAKVYPLIRKEVVRAYKPPFPEARKAFLDAFTPADKSNVVRSLILVRKADNAAPAQDLQTPELATTLRELVAIVGAVPSESVEGGTVLDRTLDGDWVIREGADAKAVLDRIADLLREEFRVDVSITVEGTGAAKKLHVAER